MKFNANRAGVLCADVYFIDVVSLCRIVFAACLTKYRPEYTLNNNVALLTALNC